MTAPLAERAADWASAAYARARRNNVPAVRVDLATVWDRTRGRCHLCGRQHRPEAFGLAWEVDHIRSLSDAGPHVPDNLGVACQPCNRRKSARSPRTRLPHDIERAILYGLRRSGAKARGIVAVRPAPQCVTALVDVLPHTIPAALDSRTAEVVAAAIGVPSVAIVRDRALTAVMIPRPVPLGIPLEYMHGEGLDIPVGVGTDGYIVRLDLADPLTAHAIVAGGTGAGKSAAIAGWLAHLVRQNSPDELRLAIIDMKQDLVRPPLSTLAHLLWRPATTKDEAEAVIAAALRELDRRITTGATSPAWVIVIDEAHSVPLADLDRLARMGRSLGIHILAGTQRAVGKDFPTDAACQLGGAFVGCLTPKDTYTATSLLGPGGAALARTLTGPGDYYAMIGRRLVRLQAAYAPPGDPFWTGPTWEKITTPGEGAAAPASQDTMPWYRRRRECPPELRDWLIQGAKEASPGTVRLPGMLKFYQHARAVLGEVGRPATDRWHRETAAMLGAG